MAEMMSFSNSDMQAGAGWPHGYITALVNRAAQDEHGKVEMKIESLLL